MAGGGGWWAAYLARGIPALVACDMDRACPDLRATLGAKLPPAGVKLAYGTAGFRTKAELLDSTFVRMGVLAALRSRVLGGAAVGLMTTASHNAAPDNGIKMVDGDGGMLAVAWEGYAQALANAPTPDAALAVLAQVAMDHSSGVVGGSAALAAPGGVVCVARDTRTHSAHLTALAVRGLQAAGAEVADHGELTTPQLHHIVRMRNAAAGARVFAAGGSGVAPSDAAAWASLVGYQRMLADGFSRLVATAEPGVASTTARGPLVVDGACGVGAPQMVAMAQTLPGLLEVVVVNHPGQGPLNEECGAEFVQKGRRPPQRGVSATEHANQRLCSFDGDGDRLIFHHFSSDGSWSLLDGDKIATLVADFLSPELRVLGLEGDACSMAVVQTAYANGASTRYLRDTAKVPLDFAKTGVKFVHHTADKYDVGVYFEANGHGTALVKPQVLERVRAARATAAPGSREAVATERLLAVHQLTNQAVGDAISDALLVEAILAVRGWGLGQWEALYTDLPSRQCKLPVVNRTVVRCCPDETRVVAPPGLQEALDALMATTDQGRCFVRPSGTEDVVRVYAEAGTQALADQLAFGAACAVFDIAGGVGDCPVPP